MQEIHLDTIQQFNDYNGMETHHPYGRTEYDFDEMTVTSFAPGQTIKVEPIEVPEGGHVDDNGNIYSPLGELGGDPFRQDEQQKTSSIIESSQRLRSYYPSPPPGEAGRDGEAKITPHIRGRRRGSSPSLKSANALALNTHNTSSASSRL